MISSDENQSLSFKLAEDYSKIRQILLVPSISIFNFVKEQLRTQLPNSSIRSAPKILDCFSPYYFKDDILLISPFIGPDGILYLLRLFKTFNNIKKINFIGYAGFIKKDNSIAPKVIENFNTYYFENSPDIITRSMNLGSNSYYNIISTRFPYLENISKIKSLNEEYSINVVDMECAYILNSCNELNFEFNSLIIISDVWDLSANIHQIIKSPLKVDSTSVSISSFLFNI